MTENEKKRIEEEIRNLKSTLYYMEERNPQAAEGVRKQIEGLENYLKGW